MADDQLRNSSSFSTAIEHFKIKSGLTSRELVDIQVTSLPNLQDALGSIQQKQLASKTQRHLRRLQPFLDSMEQYSQVINVFANTSDIVAFIWVASNFSEAFNTMLEGYSSIGESFPQFAQYEALFGNNSYMQSALSAIFEDILDFHLEAVKLFKQRSIYISSIALAVKANSGSAWKSLWHATGRGLTGRIQSLAKTLTRHKAIVETQASLEEYQQCQEFRREMRSNLEKTQELEDTRQRTRVEQWLGPIDIGVRHENAAKERFQDTGRWLLQNHRFQSWKSHDQCIDPLLWLHGMPGAGKTVLASLIVDELRKSADTTTLCFYCKNSDSQRHGVLTIAKSLMSQILTQQSSVLHYLYEEASNSSEAVLSTTSKAKELLEVALKSCQSAYIVLDGLDEYSREDRKELSSWFQSVISNLLKADFGSIRCLFISQEDGFARKDLSMLSQIKITPADNKADIEAFCADWHAQIEKKFGPLREETHNVRRIVSARAQGMFLYAKLVTWNLREQTTRADFEEEIGPDRVPEGLDAAYDRIMERLLSPKIRPQKRCDSIRKLLGWLACAKRPMKWYLVRNSHIIISDVEFDLAIRCCVYLSMPEFWTSNCDSNIAEAIVKGTYAFTDYAICFWVLHLEAALSDFDEEKTDRLLEVAECIGAFLDVHYQSSDKTYVISDTLSEHMKLLRDQPFYGTICQAIAVAKSWLRPSAKEPSNNDVLRLPGSLTQIRAVHQQLISSSSTPTDNKEQIYQHNGPKSFKCPRMNCQFFHQGFLTYEQREQHISKHERSFICVREGCFYKIIGFTTAKDLEKHVSEYHGVPVQEREVKFPEDAPPKVVKPTEPQSRRVHQRLPRKRPTSFDCHLCSNKYTRAYNLKSHLRTHTNERPFVCRMCQKGFARDHDCKRHEELHSDEKRFACKGQLSTGIPWGCGKRFGRADALSIHFKSEAGRQCIKPLVDEGAAGREKISSANDSSAIIERAVLWYQAGADGNLPTPWNGRDQAVTSSDQPTNVEGSNRRDMMTNEHQHAEPVDWSHIPLGTSLSRPEAVEGFNLWVYGDSIGSDRSKPLGES
ncbi:uncharacterized protein KY384_001787 [Bacidia gigantensis]|uniref:uncharacterized protein n=1 Tax=Bacidia gigantensis TaxID=2732470 RepID=UPI001D05A600|nr:uncharacterized protein KY384_001787 [Bacidia gigantensis]KAG8533005.1 hypothetical protein KY384_001787 [Bacidia gigantensis]